MHFISWNIGDFAKKTAHLSETEDLAYRRLLEFYYTEESALKNDPAWLARKIRMPDRSGVISLILEEFFFLAEDGLWHKNRCDNEIASYQSLQIAGRRGAQKRWENRKTGTNVINNLDSPPIAYPLPTQCQPIAPPNAPPMPTNNQEPITNRDLSKDKSKGSGELILLPPWLPTEIWENFKAHRKKIKKPMSDLSQKLAVGELEKLRRDGQDPISVINQSIFRGWSGLFPVKDRDSPQHPPPSSQRRPTYSETLIHAADMAVKNLERSSADDFD